MPCKLCRQCGHNSRTCTQTNSIALHPAIKPKTKTKTKTKPEPEPEPKPKKEKEKEPEKEKKNYCYILQQENKKKSLNYVGYTVNYNRRIRQHCGIIKGGAMYTKNRGPWEFLVVMHCPTWNNIRALQVEWLLKHPTRKRKRPKCFTGSLGRINSLVEVFHRIPKNEQITLYIHPTFFSFATSSDIKLYPNVTLVSELIF